MKCKLASAKPCIPLIVLSPILPAVRIDFKQAQPEKLELRFMTDEFKEYRTFTRGSKVYWEKDLWVFRTRMIA